MVSFKEIVRVFLHLGVSAFGGLAMLEPIRRRVVGDKAWLSQHDFLDGLALCQMAPGATVVQMAAYVGHRLKGAAGALAAAGAFVLPAFLLMTGLSFLYCHYGDLAWVKSASRGLNGVVIALLLHTLWRLGPSLSRHPLDLLVVGIALAGLWFRINYFLVLVLAGLTRLVLDFIFPQVEAALPETARPPRAGVTILISRALTAAGALAALAWVLARLDPVLGRMTAIFLKIGAVSFGGGFVMIPILQWDVVDRLGWLTPKQFVDGILLSYLTPGPLLILAAFVGYLLKGLLGGFLATLAVFTPPVLIIIFLFPFYQQIKSSRWVRPVLQGILASLAAMLALVTLNLGRLALAGWQDLAMLAAAAAALLLFRVNIIWVAAAAAAVALLIY